MLSNGHAKLIDLGLSRNLSDDVSAAGTLIYMSPELVSFKIAGTFTDYWAFGIVVFELLTGRSPWSSLTDKHTIRREIRNANVLPQLDKLSSNAVDFISGLLNPTYQNRLGTRSSEEVLFRLFLFLFSFSCCLLLILENCQVQKHRFFNQLNWKDIEVGSGTPATVFQNGNYPVDRREADEALQEYFSRPSEALVLELFGFLNYHFNYLSRMSLLRRLGGWVCSTLGGILEREEVTVAAEQITTKASRWGTCEARHKSKHQRQKGLPAKEAACLPACSDQQGLADYFSTAIPALRNTTCFRPGRISPVGPTRA